MSEAITVSTVDLSGLAWRKSSRSGSGSNADCVEVAFAEAVEWRKSSRSPSGSGADCVEVAFTGPAVAVRDSKNPAAAALAFRTAGWQSFLTLLDRPASR